MSAYTRQGLAATGAKTARVVGGTSVVGDQVVAEQVYFEAKLPTSIGGAVDVDGFLYGTTGQGLVCADFATGQGRWQERGVGPGSVCFADGRLYVHNEKDDVIVLVDPSPDAYQEKGRFTLPNQPDRGRAQAWAGERPATPRGVPLVGRSRAADNLWLNAGQGALGFTLACGSAALLTAQMSSLPLPLDARAFLP